MLAKRIDVYHYQTAWDWTEEVIREPAWPMIEEAIRRLDRFHYPWIWLRLTEEPSDDTYMTVMGGAGAYWLAISVDGYDQRRLYYPDQGTEEVAVWTSDQGFADEKCRVCFDLDKVLAAARFFAERGGFDPALPWEAQQRLSVRSN